MYDVRDHTNHIFSVWILYSRANSKPHSTKIQARNKDREGENQNERTEERATELERELESAR